MGILIPPICHILLGGRWCGRLFAMRMMVVFVLHLIVAARISRRKRRQRRCSASLKRRVAVDNYTSGLLRALAGPTASELTHGSQAAMCYLSLHLLTRVSKAVSNLKETRKCLVRVLSCVWSLKSRDYQTFCFRVLRYFHFSCHCHPAKLLDFAQRPSSTSSVGLFPQRQHAY